MFNTGEPQLTVPMALRISEQAQAQAQRIPIESLGRNRRIEVPARVRTSHACDRCRELRIKCSGGTRCTKCTKDDAICLYSDRKRERNKKDLARSAQQIDDLRNQRHLLLTALNSVVNGSNFESENLPWVLEIIDKVTKTQGETLRTASRHVSQDQVGASSRAWGVDDSSAEAGSVTAPSSAGESRARSDVGSPNGLRQLASAVDLDHGDGMVGYIGKLSDSSWIHKIRLHLIEGQSRGESDLDLRASHFDIYPITSFSYFTDDVNLLEVDGES